MQVGSDELRRHLEDTSKLANHVMPMITEVSKMSLAFRELSVAYQLTNKEIEELEMKNKALEENVQQSNETIEVKSGVINTLRGEIETLKKELVVVKKTNALLAGKNEQIQKNLFLAIECRRNEDQLEAKINSIGQQLQQVQKKVEALENNWATFKLVKQAVLEVERKLDVLSGELELHIQASRALSSGNGTACFVSSDLASIEDKVGRMDRCLSILKECYEELLQSCSSCDGTFSWRIPEVRRRIRDAKTSSVTSIYSRPFYTGKNGYKMCIRAYLNGNGTGKGTHLSVYFVLMKGEDDGLLKWPFRPKVSLILVDQDQRRNIVHTFIPDPQSSSFKRPVDDMNVACGCPQFAELSILDNPRFVKEDVMYIKAMVDISGIDRP